MDLNYYASLNRVTPRIRRSQAVQIALPRSQRPSVALEAIIYYDPANTVSANMGAEHSDLEKRRYHKGMDELLSTGLPKNYVEPLYQELYGCTTMETGVNAAGGLLTLDTVCPQETLGLHKNDVRRMGSMGFDIKGAWFLELAKKRHLAIAAQAAFYKSRLGTNQSPGGASVGVGVNL